MSCLGERDISQAYLQNNVEKLKRILPKYKKGTCSFAELIDFEDEDRILSLYILELLLKHKAEYNMKESFAQNSYRILNTQDRFVITLDKKKEIIKKYADMDQAGELVTLIEDAISFFEQITY